MNLPNMQNEIQEAARVLRLEAELEKVSSDLKHQDSIWRGYLRLAARVHQSLLPRPIQHPRINIDVRYVPMEGLGGDYCEVLFPDDSTCYVTICDVTGHDIAAALLAGRISSEARHLIAGRTRPSEIVRELNAYVLRYFRETYLLVSFFAARIDLLTGALAYSGAGHPAPLLVRGGTGPIERLVSRNLLIGVDEHCLVDDEPEKHATLWPDDRLLFFTDGAIETVNSNGEQLGEEGIGRFAAASCCPSISNMADCILDRVGTFRAGPVRDDVTLILADFPGASPGMSALDAVPAYRA